jgi:hypothetical protein
VEVKQAKEGGTEIPGRVFGSRVAIQVEAPGNLAKIARRGWYRTPELSHPIIVIGGEGRVLEKKSDACLFSSRTPPDD